LCSLYSSRKVYAHVMLDSKSAAYPNRFQRFSLVCLRKEKESRSKRYPEWTGSPATVNPDAREEADGTSWKVQTDGSRELMHASG
jgi:hypothetical protein